VELQQLWGGSSGAAWSSCSACCFSVVLPNTQRKFHVAMTLKTTLLLLCSIRTGLAARPERTLTTDLAVTDLLHANESESANASELGAGSGDDDDIMDDLFHTGISPEEAVEKTHKHNAALEVTPLWSQYGPDKQKCRWPPEVKGLSQQECQQRAETAGYSYYQYAAATAEEQSACKEVDTCDTPVNTVRDWKVFKKDIDHDETTTAQNVEEKEESDLQPLFSGAGTGSGTGQGSGNGTDVHSSSEDGEQAVPEHDEAKEKSAAAVDKEDLKGNGTGVEPAQDTGESRSEADVHPASSEAGEQANGEVLGVQAVVDVKIESSSAQSGNTDVRTTSTHVVNGKLVGSETHHTLVPPPGSPNPDK